MNVRPTISPEEARKKANDLLDLLSNMDLSHMDLFNRYSIASSKIAAAFYSFNHDDTVSLAAFADGLKGTCYEGIKSSEKFKQALNQEAFRINNFSGLITQPKHYRQVANELKSEINKFPEQHRRQQLIDLLNNIEAKLDIVDKALLAMNDVSSLLTAMNELLAKQDEMLKNEKIVDDIHDGIRDLLIQIEAEKQLIQREKESQSLVGKLSSAASAIASFFGNSSTSRTSRNPASTSTLSSSSASKAPTP